MSQLLPSVRLADAVNDNPYAAFMSETLIERVNQLQQRGAEHWASVKHELDLARATLADCVHFYSAVTLLPNDQKGKSDALLAAGQILRQAITDIARIARTAAQIESELKDRHDPAITLQFVQQVVRVVDHRLREAEERGELRDAEQLIEAISRGVDTEVRLPLDTPWALNEGSMEPSSVAPASVEDTVKAMIETVPAA